MDSLENTCAKCISRNLMLYIQRSGLDLLPNDLKTKIITYSNRLYLGLQDERILRALLHKSLKKLDLSFIKLTDATLELIFTRSPWLEEIVMKNADYRFTKSGLINFFRHLPCLKEIFISNCSVVDDEVVHNISLWCLGLDLLDVSGCSGITDESMLSITKTNVTQLNLSKTKITDESIRVLGNSTLSDKLVDINLSNCLITDEALRYLRNGKLKYIGLDGCCISDGLQHISGKLNLKFVSWTIPS